MSDVRFKQRRAPAAGSLSPRALAWRRFRRHRPAMIGLAILFLMSVVALAGPLVYGIDPDVVDPTAIRQPPSGAHLLGTDSAGRDVLARLLNGGRISLMVGFAVALCATTIGLVFGAMAGYFGGWLDAVLSRATDVVLSFPTLIIVIIVVAFVGPSLPTLIVAIGLFEWPTAYRLVRGLTLSLREREAVQAIVGLGAKPGRILRRHVFPAVVGPLTVVATLLVAQAMLLEAGLSFLGLGVPPPTASWGNMLNEAQSLLTLETMPWLWLPPGLAIAAAVLSVNFVGDGLRDAFDPRQVSG